MWKVAIIESERGWGQKIDEVRKFSTYAEAKKFQDTFNKPNYEDWERTKRVPDWYMQAEDPREV